MAPCNLCGSIMVGHTIGGSSVFYECQDCNRNWVEELNFKKEEANNGYEKNVVGVKEYMGAAPGSDRDDPDRRGPDR